MRRIALVTGASSGLGREIVRRLDAGGPFDVDEIWVVARRADRLDALVRTTRTPVRAFCLDLTDPLSPGIVSAALAEEGARVELLVNCAGAGSFGPFAGQSADAARGMVDLLIRVPVELTSLALPFMGAGSRIVNVSSVAAFLPQPGLAVYSAAKRFILDLSRSLDAELGEVGIHVTAVCPRFMDTEFLGAAGDAAVWGPMRRAVGTDDVALVARRALADAARGRALSIPSAAMRALWVASRVAPYRVALAAERLLGAI